MTNEHERLIKEFKEAILTEVRSPNGWVFSRLESKLQGMFDTLITKVREQYLRDDIERLEGMKKEEIPFDYDNLTRQYERRDGIGYNSALDTLIHQKQEELSALSKEA